MQIVRSGTIGRVHTFESSGVPMSFDEFNALFQWSPFTRWLSFEQEKGTGKADAAERPRLKIQAAQSASTTRRPATSTSEPETLGSVCALTVGNLELLSRPFLLLLLYNSCRTNTLRRFKRLLALRKSCNRVSH